MTASWSFAAPTVNFLIVNEKLTPQNYAQGFLVDDECMGGVAPEHKDAQEFPRYAAFLINHQTGEYLAYQVFAELPPALAAINSVPRAWEYERTSGCGDQNCAQNGGCKGSGCKRFPSLKPSC